VDPQRFFEDSPLGGAVFERVRAIVPEADVRVTRSQVAFRNRRAFAFLWRPRTWLGPRGAALVLSIALPHEVTSPRWKEVAHPAPATWMHHLEIADGAAIDDEVERWLRDAEATAAEPRRGGRR
jgi:hypothetical protein